MASYFKQSGAWGARVRVKGHPEVSRSSFRTKRDAQEWASVEEAKLRNSGKSQGLGPTRTTLATGLLSYAHQVTAFQHGCKQALSKLNKYLRAGGLKPLRATKVAGGREFGLGKDGEPDSTRQTVSKPCYELAEDAAAPVFEGAQQSAFAARAAANDARGALVRPCRVLLARKTVAQLVPADFDMLINTMRKAGYKKNTIRQEVAILSGFFTYAMDKWNWPMTKNPALAANWPEQESRERILAADETQRLVGALAKSTHATFAVFVLFALETAMRKGEALWTSCWCDVDFERSILKLPHGKAGRRDVPLSVTAVELLKELPRGKPTERIFGLTDNAAASAWRRLCDEAQIHDMHIHDLKHSAATVWARLFKGDLFLLQKVTGNRSLSSLRIYVNGTVDDAVQAMRAVDAPTPAQAMRQAVMATKTDIATAGSGSALSPTFEVNGPHAAPARQRLPKPVPMPVPVERRASAIGRGATLSLWRRAIGARERPLERPRGRASQSSASSPSRLKAEANP